MMIRDTYFASSLSLWLSSEPKILKYKVNVIIYEVKTKKVNIT